LKATALKYKFVLNRVPITGSSVSIGLMSTAIHVHLIMSMPSDDTRTRESKLISHI